MGSAGPPAGIAPGVALGRAPADPKVRGGRTIRRDGRAPGRRNGDPTIEIAAVEAAATGAPEDRDGRAMAGFSGAAPEERRRPASVRTGAAGASSSRSASEDGIPGSEPSGALRRSSTWTLQPTRAKNSMLAPESRPRSRRCGWGIARSLFRNLARMWEARAGPAGPEWEDPPPSSRLRNRFSIIGTSPREREPARGTGPGPGSSP